MRTRRAAALAAAGLALLFATGCFTTKSHTATRVVDYLYPDKQRPQISRGVPELTVPMRVGVAFVPEADAPYSRSRSPLTEQQKQVLLERVAANFRAQGIVKSIEPVPSLYLTPRGGFHDLERAAALLDLETIALVSLDQTQFTDPGIGRVLYWTIVGAFTVPSEKNATHTMLDTVVIHVPSRTLLFRAPGTSRVNSHATLRAQEKELRDDSRDGFALASDAMIVNLETQLAAFRQRVKEEPEAYRVVRRAGFSGAGSLDASALLLAAPFVLAIAWRLRSQ